MTEPKPGVAAMRAAGIITTGCDPPSQHPDVTRRHIEERAAIIDREHFAGPEAMELLERMVADCGWCRGTGRERYRYAGEDEPGLCEHCGSARAALAKERGELR